MPGKNEIIEQSKAAYGQWKEQWRDHAKIHSEYEMKPLMDFQNIGVGKAIVVVANGASFEKQIDTLKKHRDNCHILACDKTLGHLIDNGISPDYLLVCDANVNYEKYLQPWEDKLQDTDRKSTRLNSSHTVISYAVFCLKKKTKIKRKKKKK